MKLTPMENIERNIQRIDIAMLIVLGFVIFGIVYILTQII